MNSGPIQKKICILGMYGVGKTSLAQRLVFNQFSDLYILTLGVKVFQKLQPPLQLENGRFIQFNYLLWDIEGFDEPRADHKQYFVGAGGTLLVTDLNQPRSFQSLPAILNEFKSEAPNAPALLVGNKLDLLSGDKRSRQIHMLEEYASNLGLPYILTSAKTGENVAECFAKLGKLMAASQYESQNAPGHI